MIETRTELGAATILRVNSVDLLRGVVMVIMALDHMRDFVHRDVHRRRDGRDGGVDTTAITTEQSEIPGRVSKVMMASI